MRKIKNSFSKIWIHIRETDTLLLFLCLLTSAFGILMVCSATRNNNVLALGMSRDAVVMLGAVLLGVAAAIVISFIDYEIIMKMWPVIGGVCLFLMVLLFFIGTGPSARSDVKSWIIIGGLAFQPSELVKIGFIITFSAHLTALGDRINKFWNAVLLAVHGLIPLGLVVLTGDLGSALVFAFMLIFMLFIAGLKLRYFLLAGGLSAVALPVLWMKFFSEFQKDRLLAVYYPEGMSKETYKDIIYQQECGINAIGSGGFSGMGLFNGNYTSKGIVPESQNDMIITVVGEELGFIGCICLLLLIAAIVLKITLVGLKVKEGNAGKMLCCGTAVMIASQAIINIGMCLKLLPVIGITLPFFSAGGSSNLCLYIALGIVLSVYRSTCERKPVDFRLNRISSPFSPV